MHLAVCRHKIDLSSGQLTLSSWALEVTTSWCLAISQRFGHILSLLLIIIDSIYKLLRFNSFLHDQLLWSLEIDIAKLFNAVNSWSFHYHLINILFWELLLNSFSSLLPCVYVMKSRYRPLLFKPRIAGLLESFRFMFFCDGSWICWFLLKSLWFSILSRTFLRVVGSWAQHWIRNLYGLFYWLLVIINHTLLWYFIITSLRCVGLTRWYHISNGS